MRFALYVVFLGIGLLWFRHAPGDDLSASYIACRLFLTDQHAHLYDHHPALFHIVDTHAWVRAAEAAQFKGFLHPYVQTPIWGWLLQPLCSALAFDEFKIFFLATSLLSLIASIELVARCWARDFLNPLAVGTLLAAVVLTTPFQYSMWLVQTHSLFLAFSLGAVVLASSRRSLAAGVLLAIAAMVKITPGALVIYWLFRRQWRAAFWFFLWSLVFWGFACLAVGFSPLKEFLDTLQRVSNILLISYNNQSLVAWLGAFGADPVEIWNWHMLPLPYALALAGTIFSVASVALAGWLSRRLASDRLPIAFALIALTVFAPIAWTHYFIALIPAVMVVVRIGSITTLVVPLVVLFLNVPPIALDPIVPIPDALTLIRSHFFSGLLLMIVLLRKMFSSLRTGSEKRG